MHGEKTYWYLVYLDECLFYDEWHSKDSQYLIFGACGSIKAHLDHFRSMHGNKTDILFVGESCKEVDDFKDKYFELVDIANLERKE